MSEDAARLIPGLYQRHAQAWDRKRSRGLFERPWLDRFLALIPMGGSVLDLGCGMGEPFARHMADRGFRITGVDVAAAMVALCRTRLPEHDWIEADMRGLDLGRGFGGILAWDSFFHLTHDDQRRMFPVFHRHAAAGAALMFTSGPAHGVAMGEFEGEPLYHASLDPAEYRTLLSANGFRVVDNVAEDPGCGGHTIWLSQAV